MQECSLLLFQALCPNKVILSIYFRTAGVGGNDTLVNTVLHPPDSKRPGVWRMNAPITRLGGDGNILGRFYDITLSKDG